MEPRFGECRSQGRACGTRGWRGPGPGVAIRRSRRGLGPVRRGACADARALEIRWQPREGKALRSLVNHREGLCVFVDRPQVPLDNNLAERVLRGPAIGRRLSFGSDSENGARFTAVMYSVVGTLALNGIDVLRWLEAWLEACAKNAGRPPDDLSPWLPCR